MTTRLTDLEPRWIHPNLFVFLCPHCRTTLLSCKNVQMSHREQRELFEREFGDAWNELVVLTKADCAWNVVGTRPENPAAAFPDDLTVTPSIDASASGHWHGYITNGEIR